MSKKRKGSQKSYRLTLTADQCRAMCVALDLYKRTCMGQFQDIVFNATFQPYFDKLPLKWERRDVCNQLMQAMHDLLMPQLGMCGTYGIRCEEVCEGARVAFDMEQVIRHRLAHDSLKPGEPRGIGVDFDAPWPSSIMCALATIEQAEKGD